MFNGKLSDYRDVSKETADKLIKTLQKKTSTLGDRNFGDYKISSTTDNPRPKNFDFNQRDSATSGNTNTSGTNSNKNTSGTGAKGKNQSSTTGNSTTNGGTGGTKGTNTGAGTKAGGTGGNTPPKNNAKALTEPKSTAVTKTSSTPKAGTVAKSAPKGGGNALTEPKSTAVAKTSSTPKAGTVAKPAPKGGGNAVGTGLAVIGGVVSGADFVDLNKSKQTKTTWADVGRGASDGAGIAMGVAAIVNAIPGAGQVVYAGAVAVGAGIGAASQVTKMLTEVDCEWDSSLGKYNCCNISNISNIDAHRSNIGDKMPCDGFPFVRQCVQGKKEYDTDQGFKGKFMNDHWTSSCSVNLCKYSRPPKGYLQKGLKVNTDLPIETFFDKDNKCWWWACRSSKGDHAISLPDNSGYCEYDDSNSTQSQNSETSKANSSSDESSCNINNKKPGTNLFFCSSDDDCKDQKYWPQNADGSHCYKDKKSAECGLCTATKCKGGVGGKKG